MKILTLGKGFVSQHLPYPSTDYRIDPNINSVRTVLDYHKPDVLINCIGKTGSPNVDWCESNKSATAASNIIIPTLLAEECQKRSIKLIHVGSGCIFYGQSPNMFYGNNIFNKPIAVDLGWNENDFANPQSYYSKTKYAADLALSGLPNVATLRIRMPISNKCLDRNLINKLVKYDKVIDIPNSVTFMDDFVRCVDWVIKEDINGLYHVTNPGTVTAAQLMKEFQKYFKDHKFEVINENQLAELTVAKRSNCVLDTTKLRKAGFMMDLAEGALTRCMKEYIAGSMQGKVCSIPDYCM